MSCPIHGECPFCAAIKMMGDPREAVTMPVMKCVTPCAFFMDGAGACMCAYQAKLERDRSQSSAASESK